MSEVILIVKEDADKVIVEIIELTNGWHFGEVRGIGGAYQKSEFLCELIKQYRPKKVIFNKEKVSVAFMEAFVDILGYHGLKIELNGVIVYDDNE